MRIIEKNRCFFGWFSLLFAKKQGKEDQGASQNLPHSRRALRDRLMSRGKKCLPTVSRQFLTRNYLRPNCLLKCLPNCLSPTREGFLSSFKINPAVRVIARQVRGKTCLAAIFAPWHQSVSSDPLGLESDRQSRPLIVGLLGVVLGVFARSGCASLESLVKTREKLKGNN